MHVMLSEPRSNQVAIALRSLPCLVSHSAAHPRCADAPVRRAHRAAKIRMIASREAIPHWLLGHYSEVADDCSAGIIRNAEYPRRPPLKGSGVSVGIADSIRRDDERTRLSELLGTSTIEGNLEVIHKLPLPTLRESEPQTIYH